MSSSSSSDGGAQQQADMSGSGGTGLPCIPGGYRCGSGNSVEICNSTGTAWLYSSTCTVSCASGLCTGACMPAERRCNGKNVEECDGTGTAWNKITTCGGSCSSGKCALVSLDLASSQNLDGEVFVDGDVVVHSGATVTASTGDLTIRAGNIIVENGATITAALKGDSLNGRGGFAGRSDVGGAGGGYGTMGTGNSYTTGGAVFGADTNLEVQPGGDGGSGYGGTGGTGGGTIRLISSGDISIAGFVTANGGPGAPNSSAYSYGGGGGGAGGGILLAATGKVTVTGAVSTAGGMGGAGYYSGANGGAGGNGRVKIVAGGKRTLTGTITGRLSESLTPPIVITSSSHPDPTLIYNDDFATVDLAWMAPFTPRQGYYQLINSSMLQVPSPANSTFVNTESISYPASSLVAGSNYFHIVPVDVASNVGAIENHFLMQVNSTPPSITSSSHMYSTVWYMNSNAYFSWTLPVADKNLQGVYYVLDNYGTTIPTKSDTFVPLSQKSLLRSGIAPGIWVMHMLAMDQKGYLTKAAAHFRIQVGTDPGSGVVLGQVTNGAGMPISGAAVSINRGLWSQTTNGTGNFNISAVSAGTYELRVTANSKPPVTQMITVVSGMPTTANISVP